MSVPVRYEELWEPWYVGEPPSYEGQRFAQWEIPSELVTRFKEAKAEMEAVWRELDAFNPDRND